MRFCDSIFYCTRLILAPNRTHAALFHAVGRRLLGGVICNHIFVGHVCCESYFLIQALVRTCMTVHQSLSQETGTSPCTSVLYNIVIPIPSQNYPLFCRFQILEKYGNVLRLMSFRRLNISETAASSPGCHKPR